MQTLTIRHLAATGFLITLLALSGATSSARQAIAERSPVAEHVLEEGACATPRLGATISVASIGEPVSAVTLDPPVWTAATAASPAYCSIGGSLAPVDTAPNAQPIHFRVVLPASWTGRAIQLGGGGMNGVIPNLTGPIDGVPPVRRVVW